MTDETKTVAAIAAEIQALPLGNQLSLALSLYDAGRTEIAMSIIKNVRDRLELREAMSRLSSVP